MNKFQIMALTPPCQTDPSIAIAASRAGGIGVLDLEYVRDGQTALNAVARLVRYAKKGCGIKLHGENDRLVDRIGPNLIQQLEIIILTYGNPDSLSQQIQLLKHQGLTVLLEVTSHDQAIYGENQGVDGIIAKGNESGGRVSEETAFILLQRLLKGTSLPVWVQGGIGLHTAAACFAAGAAGVVLDSQLALTRESTLPETVKAAIGRMDGSETTCLGVGTGDTCRVYAARPGLSIIKELSDTADALSKDPRQRHEILSMWHHVVRERAGWDAPEQSIWLLGQDAAFAAPLARRFHTVGGVIEGLREAVSSHTRTARMLRPLDEGSPLARSHGTRYPIVQGPMTRVSDVPVFAASIADGGALPFLALALLPGSEVREMLNEAQRLLDNRPWGVGMLGFISQEIFKEQMEVILAYKPTFALLAGGRPDQAHALEKEGICTYMHVPSPGLLRMFLESGLRRFIFEGRECGGHVGPRSSFVLWDTMIGALLESLQGIDPAECHILFAGGIHDALSASMVATMAAPLAERGMRIGVLLGTAYLFTEEALSTGAIVKGFQDEAVRCKRTVLMESGPGHATRCADTPYTNLFMQERSRLTAEGATDEDIRNRLEEFNIGRLRIASKGVARNPGYGKEAGGSKYIVLSEEEQYSQGMYMIGQLAAMRDNPCTVEELHRDVSIKGSGRLDEIVEPQSAEIPHLREAQPCDIAIIGMACLLPKAGDLQTYWENILNKVDAITEIPKDRWDWRDYFDPNPKEKDKVYSKWGGFIDPIQFDPIRYGMPPNTLSSIEPLQLLTLEVVRMAIEDAGYSDRPFSRESTSVIIGASGGAAELGQQYSFRSSLPMFFRDVPQDLLSGLPEWTEDSFAGILLNVAAGRVANRFDLGGVNYTVDAACASSLAAVYSAVRELENGASDMVVVGGADTLQNPFAYLCFSKTHALSPRGRCRTFDEGADGIVISEGISVIVLKRLADAERDGDRIYAVIKSVGGSSDGRDKGLTAPRPEGQVRALNRAYSKSGLSPATIGLIEAHGTGTVIGDRTEVETLKKVFESAGAVQQSCAIGSVKSLIGHTKSTAGLAGMIKVALSLYHKILPPTTGVENPNSILTGSPFYVNTETRPWIHGADEHRRRAGVSAFGFGGTNFHAVVEEYGGNFLESAQDSPYQEWPGELLIWEGNTRKEILEAIESLDKSLQDGAKPELRDLAYTLWKDSGWDSPRLRLAMVSTSLDDLRQKLKWTKDVLIRTAQARIQDPRGIYYTEEPIALSGKVAFLFPGQGSQYPDMLRDLTMNFPEVRERFEHADRTLSNRFPSSLSAYIFPPPRFNKEEEKAAQRMLTQTNIAQPALGAADMGILSLLQSFGLKPDMVAGHSYGEYVALCVAGVFNEDALYNLSEARGRFIMEMSGNDLGAMTAVDAGQEVVTDVIQSVDEVWIANLNAPGQTIISGSRLGIEEAVRLFTERGIQSRPVKVSCAFHSPLIAPARDRLAEYLATIEVAMPGIDVFSNSTAQLYPGEPQAIVRILSDHLVNPVNFEKEIDAMYEAGARIFVEVGPRNILTGLTQQILEGRQYLAVSTDIPGRSGLLQIQHVLGQLISEGVTVHLDRLYQGRRVRKFNLKTLVEQTKETATSPTTWLVDGLRARPVQDTEGPKVFKVPGTSLESSMKTGSTTNPKTVTDETLTKSDNILKREDTPQPVASSLPSADGETAQVMLQFQQLMNKFLETQQQVMRAYLQDSTGGDGASSLKVPDFVRTQEPLAIRTEHPGTQRPAESSTTISRRPVEIKTDSPEPSKGESDVSPVPVIGREQVTAQLLQVVSERTGYPKEMLDLDLNIEADLGIDSIKRIEILGTLQRTYLSSGNKQVAMEEMTKIKTLRGIIDWITDCFQAPEAEDVKQQEVKKNSNNGKVPRFLLESVDAPIGIINENLHLDSLFVITGDESGVAQILSERLRHAGGRIINIHMGERAAEADANNYIADLTDPDSVSSLVELIRQQHGPISGLIHLLPLRAGVPFSQSDMKEWRMRLSQEVKGLFYLIKAAGTDLKEAAKAKGGRIIAATAMGDPVETSGDDASSFFPGQGGIAGLIKTAALEFPGVRCKVVHIDPNEPVSSAAANLYQEIACDDEIVEVRYTNSGRTILRAKSVSTDSNSVPDMEMDSEWVVLITGGARGITAEIAIEIANRYKPTLILAGRSPLPDLREESGETAGLTSPQEIKAALINRMKRAGETVSPPMIEAACSRLLQDREIRRTLSAIEQAGARVRYYQVDVRSEDAFASLIDGIYHSYGRLDGVIHGAGVIEDKLIENKIPDSFDRVFDTKADSAFILSRRLRPDSLKFLIFFSSVAGCFGNRGQGDYAAANEVLNKMAVYLDHRWPGRVAAINWGPWAKAGMVSAEVERQFAERGVQLIPPGAGRLLFDDELRFGRKGESEVVIGNGPWGEVLPLLWDVMLERDGEFTTRMELTLNPEYHMYLLDHQLDGKPVLPIAVAVEIMAEAAKKSWPDRTITGMDSLQVYRRIVLDNDTPKLFVTARLQSNPSNAGHEINIEIFDSEHTAYPCYRATVQMGDKYPKPPTIELPNASGFRTFPLAVDEAYRNWSFHGPSFQGISVIEGINEEGICADILLSTPGDFLHPKASGHWLMDPVVLDASFQLALLWGRAHYDVTSIPMRFSSYRLFSSFTVSPIRCYVKAEYGMEGQVISTDNYFFDASGCLLAFLKGVEFSCSRQFNRLTGLVTRLRGDAQ
ncbi:MAG TPA: SDR family NAD(P)-dependent oxidoreductase [Nitrospirota bacterium]|nr:SDR family NAD(P)-dependent oxidoreductase [Nitrospirota bacterium]